MRFSPHMIQVLVLVLVVVLVLLRRLIPQKTMHAQIHNILLMVMVNSNNREREHILLFFIP